MAFNIKTESFPTTDPLVLALHVLVASDLQRKPERLLMANASYALIAPDDIKNHIFVPKLPAFFVIAVYSDQTRRMSICNTTVGANNFNSYSDQFRWLTPSGGEANVLVVYSAQFPPGLTDIHAALLEAATPLGLTLTFASQILPAECALRFERGSRTVTILHLPPKDICHAPPRTRQDFGRAGMFDQIWMLLSHAERTVQTELLKESGGIWRLYSPEGPEPRLPILSELTRDLLRNLTEERLRAEGSRLSVTKKTDQALERLFATSAGKSAKERVDRLLGGIVAAGAFCMVCGENDPQHLKKCSGCDWESYCSPEHQRLDWPHHKSWCKKNRKSSF